MINASGDTSEKEIKPKDAAAKEPEPQKQIPGGAATRDLNISEKVNDKDTKLANGKPGQGTPEGDNHTNEENTAKDDKNTKIAKAQNDIVNAAVNKSGITGMLTMHSRW